MLRVIEQFTKAMVTSTTRTRQQYESDARRGNTFVGGTCVQTGTIRKLGCGFLLAFHSKYGSILHHFLDTAIYWSKIVIFFIPRRIRHPRYEAPIGSEYRHPVWYGKLEWWAIPDGEKTEDVYNRLNRIPACDGGTDGGTDGQKDRRADRRLSTAQSALCIRVVR